MSKRRRLNKSFRRVRESQFVTDAENIVFEEKDLDALKQMKASMDKYNLEGIIKLQRKCKFSIL